MSIWNIWFFSIHPRPVADEKEGETQEYLGNGEKKTMRYSLKGTYFEMFVTSLKMVEENLHQMHQEGSAANQKPL